MAKLGGPCCLPKKSRRQRSGPAHFVDSPASVLSVGREKREREKKKKENRDSAHTRTNAFCVCVCVGVVYSTFGVGVFFSSLSLLLSCARTLCFIKDPCWYFPHIYYPSPPFRPVTHAPLSLSRLLSLIARCSPLSGR